MESNNIHIYSKFAYSEKLRITNLHKPFAESSALHSVEQAQLSTLFTEISWLNDYYPDHMIADLQVFDIVDFYSEEPYLSLFLFKEYCYMFKYQTTECFGYVEDNNDPLGFSIAWQLTGSTPAEDLLRTYKTLINVKEALDLFLAQNEDALERYLHIDLSAIGIFRHLFKTNELEKNRLDPAYISVYDELYEWIVSKVLNIIQCTLQQNGTSLNLNGYCLELLPEEICNCTHLQYIDLSDNRLSCLPDGIQKLQQLKYIDLSQNSLSEFPMQLLEISGLETLLFDLNNIQTLPPAIVSLKHLRKIDVDRNPITNIPEHIRNEGSSKILKYLSGL